MNKKYCPFIRDNCMKDKCSLWIPDGQRVISKKTHKPEIKDTSGCALMKIGERASQELWITGANNA